MALDLAKIDPDDDPQFLAWLKDNYPNEMDGRPQHTYVWKEDMEDWGIARANFVCELLSTGDLVVTITGGTQEEDEDIQYADPEPPIVIKRKVNNNDGPTTFDFKVQCHPARPDRQ